MVLDYSRTSEEVAVQEEYPPALLLWMPISLLSANGRLLFISLYAAVKVLRSKVNDSVKQKLKFWIWLMLALTFFGTINGISLIALALNAFDGLRRPNLSGRYFFAEIWEEAPICNFTGFTSEYASVFVGILQVYMLKLRVASSSSSSSSSS